MSPLPGTAQIAGGPDPEQCPLPIHAALWQRPENNQGRTSRGTQRVCTGRGHECTVTGRHLTVCAGVSSCGERGEDVELVSYMDKGKCNILCSPLSWETHRRAVTRVRFIALPLVLSRIIRSGNE